MGAETEPIRSIVPKIPLFSPHEHKETIQSSSSPLHHTLASVPFQWEKEPGKPNTINLRINNIKPKCLEPPPRLYSINTPSPITVLDGPYNITNVKPKFSSSSFRFLKNKRKGGSSSSSVFLSSMDSIDIDEGRISCSARMASFRTNGSSSNLTASRSRMWAHIYEGFKKAIPWKSSKSKNCSSCNFQH
ncbi:hypothetical protein K7X08_026467 [Anisodus acutangulus]|uniref:Uncharacterized protein n=1 Tax=Anisodus acutangulus TaxID=402998 RepID=A0A9Q1LN76_9SOLA|nr:hypothetical protein K7X08_026467 [Anisodus acutangulus]